MRGLRQRFVDPLFEEVDGASLAFFRVAFGAIMLVECWRFWSRGWIERHYIEPEFFFKYYGFEWVAPWPGDGMYWHFAALAALSLLIILGVAWRFATVLFLAGFTYVFLLDQARYLNHFYLVILVALLLAVMPAPAARMPAWPVWLLPSRTGQWPSRPTARSCCTSSARRCCSCGAPARR